MTGGSSLELKTSQNDKVKPKQGFVFFKFKRQKTYVGMVKIASIHIKKRVLENTNWEIKCFWKINRIVNGLMIYQTLFEEETKNTVKSNISHNMKNHNQI